LPACVWSVLAAIEERTLSVKSQAKRQRRVRRRSEAGRFGQAPRIEIVADDRSLTPFGGSAVVGELVRRLELIPALDRAIEMAPRVGGLGPVKQRARGCSPGQLLVAVADSMLCGGDSMLDLERLRADEAGAELRAVAAMPAASTACQLARRYRRSHLRGAEAAFAACANAMDAQLGRSPEGAVTLDFDSTGVEVYGRNKPGAGVTYRGELAYQPLICAWAQRGRLLGSELLAGNASTRGEEPRGLLRRVLGYLPAGHGPVSARFDSGFYRVDLLADCRAREVRFSISVPRSSAMWAALERIEDDAWQPAEALGDAEVAQTTYSPAGWEHEPLRLIVRRVAHQADALSVDPRARRRRTIPTQQLNLGLTGEADVVYGYSFVLTDLDGDAATVEHHHRDRAQIEERIKDAKLGVSLRRLPLSDLDANRVWLHCSTLALNLLALLNDLMFGTDPPGHLPRRRQAKFVRRMLLCVPARVIHHARRIILRLPAGLSSAPAFQAAYNAARGLGPPALA
jgi:Transposase DDE domain group 1